MYVLGVKKELERQEVRLSLPGHRFLRKTSVWEKNMIPALQSATWGFQKWNSSWRRECEFLNWPRRYFWALLSEGSVFSSVQYRGHQKTPHMMP